MKFKTITSLLLLAGSVFAFESSAETHLAKTKTLLSTMLPIVNTADTVHTSELVFIDLDENGDDKLLFASNLKDTLNYVVHELPAMLLINRGDIIKVKWKTGKYIPAGDPDSPEKRNFVVDIQVVKPGKLSLDIEKGIPHLRAFYLDDDASNYLKGRIITEIRYYLSNTKLPVLRKLMDQPVPEIVYSVEKINARGKEVYDISFSLPAKGKEKVIQKVRYDFEKPYQLNEVR